MINLKSRISVLTLDVSDLRKLVGFYRDGFYTQRLTGTVDA